MKHQLLLISLSFLPQIIIPMQNSQPVPDNSQTMMALLTDIKGFLQEQQKLLITLNAHQQQEQSFDSYQVLKKFNENAYEVNRRMEECAANCANESLFTTSSSSLPNWALFFRDSIEVLHLSFLTKDDRTAKVCVGAPLFHTLLQRAKSTEEKLGAEKEAVYYRSPRIKAIENVMESLAALRYSLNATKDRYSK